MKIFYQQSVNFVSNLCKISVRPIAHPLLHMPECMNGVLLSFASKESDNKKAYISVSLIWQCCGITARMKCLAMLIVIRKNMAF